MNQNQTEGLADLVARGGILYHLPGASPREALTALVAALGPREAVPADTLLTALLEREGLMPTGIGRGIALPHPRNPVLTEGAEQFAAIAFLHQGVDWKALDGKPVHTLILLVSASAKRHLENLSKITFFCHDQAFQELLARRASREELLAFIRDAERAWE